MRYLISGFILSIFPATNAAGADAAFTVKSADIQDQQTLKAARCVAGDDRLHA